MFNTNTIEVHGWQLIFAFYGYYGDAIALRNQLSRGTRQISEKQIKQHTVIGGLKLKFFGIAAFEHEASKTPKEYSTQELREVRLYTDVLDSQFKPFLVSQIDFLQCFSVDSKGKDVLLEGQPKDKLIGQPQELRNFLKANDEVVLKIDPNEKVTDILLYQDTMQRAVGLTFVNAAGRQPQIFYEGRKRLRLGPNLNRHIRLHINPNEQLCEIITNKTGTRFGARVLVRRLELFRRDYRPRN